MSVYRGWSVEAFPGRIRIRVLDPVTLAEAGGSADALRELARERMLQVLTAMRRQRAAGETA